MRKQLRRMAAEGNHLEQRWGFSTALRQRRRATRILSPHTELVRQRHAIPVVHVLSTYAHVEKVPRDYGGTGALLASERARYFGVCLSNKPPLHSQCYLTRSLPYGG